MKNLLSISGGATDIAALFGVAKGVLANGFEPDVFAGVSAGAILALPLALKKYSEIERLVLSFTLDDIFEQNPISKRGKLNFAKSVLGLMRNNTSLGDYGKALRNTIKKVVSKSDFAKLKNDVFVGVVNINENVLEIVNLRNCDYETAIEYVVASATIPIFSKPVEINGNLYVDGGIKDHNIANRLIGISDISELVSIYVRDEKKRKEIADISCVASQTLKSLMREVSDADQVIEEKYCRIKNIQYTCLIVTSAMESFFDTDKERLKIGYKRGFAKGMEYKSII